MKQLHLNLQDEQETEQVGQRMAASMMAPLTVYLSGPLGAGKSTLIRALLRSKGVKGPIKSPTYALVEPYSFSSYSIYHFDFYRFFDENEWEESGFRDYFSDQSIRLVEWPEKAGSVLPAPDLVFELVYKVSDTDPGTINGRTLTVSAISPAGLTVLEEFER